MSQSFLPLRPSLTPRTEENSVETITATEAPAVEQGKTVNVTAFFALSSAGQKAAILAGLPAAKTQSISGPVPAADLDLCTILTDGSVVVTAYQLYGDESKKLTALAIPSPFNTPGACASTVMLDTPPAGPQDVTAAIRANIAAKVAEREALVGELDAMLSRMVADPDLILMPPSVYSGDPRFGHPLYAECARRRVVVEIEKQEAAATEFLADAGLRARIDTDGEVHIGPISAYITGTHSQMPLSPLITEACREAIRRKQGDEAAAKQAEADVAAAKLAFVRSWLVEHGTTDQIERLDAKLLDGDEYLAAMRDAAFAPLAEYPLYRKITGAEVRAAVDDEDGRYEGCEAEFRSVDPGSLTSAQWASLKALRAALPQATVEPKRHEGTLDSDDVAWGVVERMGAVATIQYGPFTFRREYAL